MLKLIKFESNTSNIYMYACMRYDKKYRQKFKRNLKENV